jgi:hypothetical protein
MNYYGGMRLNMGYLSLIMKIKRYDSVCEPRSSWTTSIRMKKYIPTKLRGVIGYPNMEHG